MHATDAFHVGDIVGWLSLCCCHLMGVSSIPGSSNETVYIGSARINKNWHYQDKITQSACTSHFSQSMVI